MHLQPTATSKPIMVILCAFLPHEIDSPNSKLIGPAPLSRISIQSMGCLAVSMKTFWHLASIIRHEILYRMKYVESLSHIEAFLSPRCNGITSPEWGRENESSQSCDGKSLVSLRFHSQSCLYILPITKDRAYTPYSNFAVSTAKLCKEGRLITGACVDNASPG